jgi:hypothetical protein
LRPGQRAQDGAGIAQALMAQLGIAMERLVQGAYLDLILPRSAPGAGTP